MLALGRSTAATTRFVLAHQARNGGFAVGAGGQPDSNDTAAALEALRVAGVRGQPVTRAVAFLRDVPEPRRRLRADARPRLRRAVDGVGDPGPRRGGRASRREARSPTWRACKRPDGSYRYSAQYATTPVWVTSQVLAALAKKPFPLGGA